MTPQRPARNPVLAALHFGSHDRTVLALEYTGVVAWGTPAEGE